MEISLQDLMRANFSCLEMTVCMLYTYCAGQQN
jgi:hypothetical protein